MSKIHHFDAEEAKIYGMPAAAILYNFRFWLDKNIAEKQRFYDGQYWIYCSVSGLDNIFPYLSKKQIRSAIERLVDDGVLATGNYNKSTYDRTLWYCIVDYGVGKCICPTGQMEVPCGENGNAPEGNSYKDNNNPDSNPDDNKRTTNVVTKSPAKDELSIAVDDWNAVASQIGLPQVKKLTSKRKTHLKARLKDTDGLDGWRNALRKLAASSFCRGEKTDWKADFDFVLQESSFLKLVEGKYDDNQNRSPSHAGQPQEDSIYTRILEQHGHFS